jgi:hypothetical protein
MLRNRQVPGALRTNPVEKWEAEIRADALRERFNHVVVVPAYVDGSDRVWWAVEYAELKQVPIAIQVMDVERRQAKCSA